MASQAPQLHFVLFPLMAQGHMIPMMDIAKILVQRNVIVTVVTTPHNAARFTSVFESESQIRLVQLPFPCKEAGLPDGCENLDMLPSFGMALSFFNATSLLRQPVEEIFEELTPPPSCIISDSCMLYTTHVATKFNIPRISFMGVNCFYSLCLHNINISNIMKSKTSESEYFVVPGLPDKIEITKAQTGMSKDESWNQFLHEFFEAELASYGRIMNSFEEMESAYVREYKKVLRDKAWCIGPLSLCNKNLMDKAQRGKKTSIHESHLRWLDSQKPNSVIYVCFGSLCNLLAVQLIELGLALEASERPFIWVIKEGSQLEALEKWIKEDGFVERTKTRSLVILGWAPQLVILSHPAIGGFLTHCGWNSTLEAISAGVPMITWPLFGDQFLNESFAVQVLKVGVKVGAKSPVEWGKEEKSDMLKKEQIRTAIDKLMDESSESKERRKRVGELAEIAKKAVEKGGSSHTNVTLLIQDIMQRIKGDDGLCTIGLYC